MKQLVEGDDQKVHSGFFFIKNFNEKLNRNMQSPNKLKEMTRIRNIDR